MRYAPCLVLAFACACGGSDSEGLLSGSATGTFDTTTFTVKNGVMGVAQGSTVIALSSEGFDCSTLNAPSPPAGNYAAISVSQAAVGSYSNTFVMMYQNHGDFSAHGSGSGTLEITAITEQSVSATITYSDTIDGKSYAINGTFEVTRCP